MSRKVQSQWVRCPPGEFARLAKRLGRRRGRRLFLIRTGASAAAATAVAGGTLWALLRPRDAGRTPPEVLSCAQVKAHAGAYGKGELSDQLNEQVRQHLASCVPCREFYQRLGLLTHAPNPPEERRVVASRRAANPPSSEGRRLC